ncbi:DUF6841 family protein [Streptomyces sp. NPDC004008]
MPSKRKATTWTASADHSEIERLAVHFEVARGAAGWRVVGIQLVPTTEDSSNAAWRSAS